MVGSEGRMNRQSDAFCDLASDVICIENVFRIRCAVEQDINDLVIEQRNQQRNAVCEAFVECGDLREKRIPEVRTNRVQNGVADFVRDRIGARSDEGRGPLYGQRLNDTDARS